MCTDNAACVWVGLTPYVRGAGGAQAYIEHTRLHLPLLHAHNFQVFAFIASIQSKSSFPSPQPHCPLLENPEKIHNHSYFLLKYLHKRLLDKLNEVLVLT